MYDDRQRYGEVQFYFYHAMKGLAMVSLFGVEDAYLRDASLHAVWACEGLTESYIVIEATEVICGVAMIPHVFTRYADAVEGPVDALLYLAYDKMGSEIGRFEEREDDGEEG